jgi:hypothetical protein
VLRPAVQADDGAIVVDLEAELGGDDHLVTDGLQRFAHQFLVDKGAIAFGGIEQRDPAVDGGPDDADRLALFRGGAKAEAQAHAA